MNAIATTTETLKLDVQHSITNRELVSMEHSMDIHGINAGSLSTSVYEGSEYLFYDDLAD